jgi:hypothetical protein
MVNKGVTTDEVAAPSRRSVLSAAAGAGAAGIAAAALGRAVPGAAHAGQIPASDAPAAGAHQDEAVIVHVRDVATGEIDLFRGTAQTRVHDRALALRIVRASR